MECRFPCGDVYVNYFAQPDVMGTNLTRIFPPRLGVIFLQCDWMDCRSSFRKFSSGSVHADMTLDDVSYSLVRRSIFKLILSFENVSTLLNC